MPETIHLVVVGAHLQGQPLNHELTELGATLVQSTHTAAKYRMYALAGAAPKPGLVRVTEAGRAFEVEEWSLPRSRFGEFIAKVRSPLCIGSLELMDARQVLGFLCEPFATAGATDISEYSGWRAYRARSR
jgi:allophanate hydrolase